MIKEELKFSIHISERMVEREILKEWIFDTIENYVMKDEIADDEIHFYKTIPVFGNKCLKVVVNPKNKLIVTAYFDRNKTKTEIK